MSCLFRCYGKSGGQIRENVRLLASTVSSSVARLLLPFLVAPAKVKEEEEKKNDSNGSVSNFN